MKHFLLSVGLLLCTGVSTAQTVQLNQEKYWKFRNSFREKFVKIGNEQGESLPAGAVLPLDCVDNFDVSQDGTPYSSTKYGEMRWGDGMIRHGNYLTLLATEYRLLKNSGQNEQAQATLNELYYALNAIFRLDQFAELNQDQIHGTSTNLQNPNNGFYNREDINKDFATTNWLNTRAKLGCVNSPFSKSNNIANINNPSQGFNYNGNSYQNVPSLDQMTSLLVGLAMVIRFVDPVTVQPTAQDQSKNLVALAKDQLYFMITYASKNNWFILDVHGWPVNNGGGDLLLAAPALIRIFERNIGNTALNTTASRRLLPYKMPQALATGFGTNEPYTGGIFGLTEEELNVYYLIHNVVYNCYPGISDQFNNSRFLRWQYCGHTIDANSNVLNNLWHNFIPNNVASMSADWENDHQFNSTFGLNGTLFDEVLGSIEFSESPLKSNNNTLTFNLGVLTGWWDGAICGQWGDITNNRQLELINSLLNGFEPSHQVGFYKTYLDSLTLAGPYYLNAGHWNGSTTTNIKELFHDGGWAGEYKWPNATQAQGINGEKGIFSALDYMVYYNLFQLQFGNQLPEYKESWTCNCAAPIVASGPGGPDDQDAYNTLNQKLSYIDVCQENVFYPVNNLVANIFDIQPKFSNYSPIGIYTTKFQTQNAAVLPTGDINVRTRFVVCNGSTLNVQAGGRIDVEVKEMIVNTDGTVTNSGDILVRVGTQLVLKSGSKLILKNGSTLKIEGGAKLIIEEGAILEYYNGANIVLLDATSEIVHGGTIKTMDATTFSINGPNTNIQKGKLIISSPTSTFLAEVPAYFELEGNGFTDPFITINVGAKLTIDDPEITTFRVADCIVELKENASVIAKQPYYSYSVRYNSTATNGGVTVFGSNIFYSSHFLNVPVKAILNIQNSAPFSASECNFTANNATINSTDLALVTVTGMSFQLANCVFVGNRNYGIRSSNMVTPSNAIGCTFSQFGASGTTMVGISDISNVEIKATSSIFTKCFSGITKASGKLSLKCNTFNTNTSTNVSVTSGCALNMATGDLAGYNYMNKTAQNKNIQLSASTISLRSGYNFIEECTNTVFGILSTTCTFPNCTINFSDNQWNLANTVPAQSSFQISSANLLSITPSVAAIALKPACGFYDGPIVIGPPKGKSTFDTDGMPIIYSVIAADSIRLDDAIIAGMERMTNYDDSLGNDLEAVEHFSEVYTSDVDLSDSLTKNLLWFTLEQMKSSLENAVASGQITTSQNTVSFESHVEMYANALMKMTDAVIEEDNYRTQFYHEIDKAHLFRVIGHSEIGLNILTELEACGIDSVEQAQLNYWKQEFEKDLVIEAIGFAAMDSIIEIDTSGYLNPALVVNAYSFGAIINSMNDIHYPNCSFFGYRDQQWKTAGGLFVFPNPASDEVTIRWTAETTVGQTTMVIQQADGRVVMSKKVDNAETNSLKVVVSNWKPGVYQVRVTAANGKQSVAQLVIQ